MQIRFPDTVPKSEIIGNSELNSYQKCYELFKKYVINQAYFCINIPHKTRLIIYNKFGVTYQTYNESKKDSMINYLQKNTKISDLEYIFADAFLEIYMLLKEPFDRFQTLNGL